jgi:hypothetical protein
MEAWDRTALKKWSPQTVHIKPERFSRRFRMLE